MSDTLETEEPTAPEVIEPIIPEGEELVTPSVPEIVPVLPAEGIGQLIPDSVTNPVTPTVEEPLMPPWVDGPPSIDTTRLMSPLVFMARLTAEEENAITTAAISNPQMFKLMLQLTAAQEIDLVDPRTIGGVEAMGAAGILTAEREVRVGWTVPPTLVLITTAPSR
jgi:hypothetical protein